MAAAGYDPGHGAVEAVVVARREVDDAVVEGGGGLSGFGGPPRPAGGLGQGEVSADFCFRRGLRGCGLVSWRFAAGFALGGGVGGGSVLRASREDVGEGVRDAVYLCEFFVGADHVFVFVFAAEALAFFGFGGAAAS